DLPWPERRYEEYLERSTLLLPRQRDGGHQGGDEGEHERNEAGYEQVHALEHGVVAHPYAGLDPYHACSCTEVCLEALDNRPDVGRHPGAAVGVCRVGDDE